MLRAYVPRRAMVTSLTWVGLAVAGWRWIASVTAQRSIREPCLDACPRIL